MKRTYRLRRNSDFQQVRREGKSYASSLIVLAFLPNKLEQTRFGFVVSKRIGKAVTRNKIKRQMREAIRLNVNKIRPGFDVVFIARKPIVNVTYSQIVQTLDLLLKRANLHR